MRNQRKIAILVMSGVLLAGCAGTNHLEEGVSLLKQEKYEEALDSFEKEVKAEKHLGEAYRGMGIAYFESDEFEKAVESFEKALENEAKETGTIYNLMGISHMRMEQYEEAVKAFEKGVTMEDCSREMKQEMQFNTIAAYEKMGDWENAKQCVKEYLSQYPDDEKAVKEAEFLESR